MEKRRVLVAGLGTANPLGHNATDTWQTVRDGVYGIGLIIRYDCSTQKVCLTAEVKDWDPTTMLDKKDVWHMSRYVQLAATATKEASTDSGLDRGKGGLTRCDVVVSSDVGGIEMAESEELRRSQRGLDRTFPFYIPTTIVNMGAGFTATTAGFQGMCTCPVAACVGGSNAVDDAFRHIRDGYTKVVPCGGAETATTPLFISGFTSMRALHVGDDSGRAPIPFGAERSGFVMDKGATVLMLEEYGHAMVWGAKIYAGVVGYGATCDAYHITASAPNGEGDTHAMALALVDVGVFPEQVDYISAHGISTPLDDSGETTAIKVVFGAHVTKLTTSSTKAMIGHILGAAGAAEAIFTVLGLRDDFLPATIHCQIPDPVCDLDYIPNQGREQQAEYALSNSLGFGGHNACVLFKKWGGRAMMQLNSSQIAETIPRRYPFALVDRIVDGGVGKQAEGTKCVIVNELFFQGHFLQYHVIPGVLIIEALAQMEAVTMLSMSKNEGKISPFGSTKDARLRRQVTPGDVLELEHTILEQKGPVTTAEAKATTGGQLAVSTELTSALAKDL